MYTIGLGLISSSLFAAGVGPYQFDDVAAAVTVPLALPVVSSTTIQTKIQPRIGQMVICNSCSNVAGSYSLCIATSTTVGASFVVVGTTNTAILCQ